MRGMNLSKFKKMKETAEWADMIHQDGHILRIAKGPLSHIHRKQLESLPYSTQGKYSEGGKIKEGLPPLEIEAIADPVSANSQPLQVEEIPQSAQPSQNISAQIPTAQMSAPQIAQQQANLQQQLQQQAQAGAPAQQVPQQAPAPQLTQPQSPIQAKTSAIEAEQKANNAAAAAEQQKANESVAAYNDVENKIKALPTQNQVLEKYKASSDRLMNAYAQGKIDPDHYWKDHSKTSAGIGVLISSLGQALGGTNGNVALDNIKNAVSRDIQLQKDDQEKSMNLWKMNRQVLGDDMSANLATQNQLYTGLQYKIQKAAARGAGAMAGPNAQKANAQLEQLKAENNYKLSLMNPTSDNPDPSTRVNFLVPEPQRAKAFEEIKQRQYIVKNAPGILDAFDEAGKDTRFLGGHTLKSITPTFHTPGQNKFMGLVAPTVADIEGSVNQQNFKNLDDRFTPRFTDSEEDIAGKRQALIHYLSGKDSSPVTLGNYIDLNKFPSTDTSRIGKYGAPGAQKPDIKYIKDSSGEEHEYRLNRATGKYE